MKIENFTNYKVAEERARELLLSDSVTYPTLTTTKRKVELPSPDSYIISLTDEESRSIAIIKRSKFNKRVGEDWDSPEAWVEEETSELLYISPSDEVIYPFRNLNLYSLVFAFMMRGTHNPFVKPTEALSPEYVQSVEGEIALRNFFGEADTTENEIDHLRHIQDSGADTDLWQEWEEEDGTINLSLSTSITRPIFFKAIGKMIHSEEDAVEAVAALSGGEISKEKEEEVRTSYNFYQRELFLYYCIYSFLITEQYSDLKKALSHYRKFGLPKNWYVGFILLEGDSPEEYIISHYYDTDTFKLLSVTSLRELSEFTGIPLPLLIQCSTENSRKRAIRKRYKKQ